MKNDTFFAEQRAQSQIKSLIVTKYFWIWAKIISAQLEKYPNNSQDMCYMDLFAGQGRYENGDKSTPLIILEKAIADPKIGNKLITIFNDEDKNTIEKLKREVNNLKGIEKLHHPPMFLNLDVCEISIPSLFTKGKIPPTLLFADPFGYKGLSLDLFSFIKNWACEVIFFFNYRRINPALDNFEFKENMTALFGEKISTELNTTLHKLDPKQRHELIIEKMGEALMSLDPKIMMPLKYKFMDIRGTRVTHHLIFVTKHKLGHSKMKEIMLQESTETPSNGDLFTCNQANINQLKLIEDNPVDELMDILCKTFKGKKMKVKDIYEQHNVGTPYISKNYKEALRLLEEQNRVEVYPPKNVRRTVNGKISVGDDIIITFLG